MPATEIGSVGYNRRNLYFAACSVYTLFVAVGMVMGWASPSLQVLKDEKHNFTSAQSNLLASICGLAPGPLLTIFGIDTIGRKGTLFVIWSTIVISPAIMMVSTDIYVLLVARFIGGIGMGAAFSAIGIYLSEISDVSVRNSLNSASMLFLTVGSLISNSVGPFVHFFTFMIVSLAVSSVFGFLWYFLPESPYYYAGKNNIEKARSSLLSIKKGASSDLIEIELSAVQLSIEEERRNKTGIKKLLSSKAVFKQFVLSFYLLYLQQGSGTNPIGTYALELFRRAKLDFDAKYVPIGLTLITFLILIPLPLIVKRFGNKSLFLIGGYGSGTFMVSVRNSLNSAIMLFLTVGSLISNSVGPFVHFFTFMIVSLAVSSVFGFLWYFLPESPYYYAGKCRILLGTYFIFLDANYDLSSINFLSIIFVLGIYIVGFIGMGGIVWGTVADLFAPSVKGSATGICGIFSTFLGFVVTLIFGTLKDKVGFGISFVGFGVVEIIASFGLFFIPDTTKLSLQEIQDYFEGNSSRSPEKPDIS